MQSLLRKPQLEEAPHTWILRVRGAKCPKVEMALSRKDYEGT